MLALTPARETAAEKTIENYVRTQVGLGVYNPNQPRRERVDVQSFEIEILEFDEAEAIAHAGGPVRLRTPAGDVEQYLRVSVPVSFAANECFIPAGAAVRAAYIIESEGGNGACKETAALSNA